MYGVGYDVAAKLLVAAGDNPDRLHSEAAFAHLCGVAPLEASSGKTRRHRLNRGGNRQANNALYRVVITRMASHPATQRLRRPAPRRRQDRPVRSSASSSATSPAKPSNTSAPPPHDLTANPRTGGDLTPTNRPTPLPGCSTNDLSTAAPRPFARAVTYQEPALQPRVADLCLVHSAPTLVFAVTCPIRGAGGGAGVTVVSNVPVVVWPAEASRSLVRFRRHAWLGQSRDAEPWSRRLRRVVEGGP